jgi:predicted nucleic acid-binding protein
VIAFLEDFTVTQVLVRNLDDEVKAALQRRAAAHGRSLEAEVRDILRAATPGGCGAEWRTGLGDRGAVRRGRAGRRHSRTARPSSAAGRFRGMILLDTNVLSALMRTVPDATVVAWLDRQPRVSVWTTAVTVLEIRHSLALLPAGRRREALASGFARLVDTLLDRRVAPFEAAAELLAARARGGRPAELRDTMIAGIAEACRATIATGNMRHFADLSVPVVDPWAAAG